MLVPSRERPHYYVGQEPGRSYNGCQICGYGPNAFVHNHYEVDRYIFARLLGLTYEPAKELEMGGI